MSPSAQIVVCCCLQIQEDGHREGWLEAAPAAPSQVPVTGSCSWRQSRGVGGWSVVDDAWLWSQAGKMTWRERRGRREGEGKRCIGRLGQFAVGPEALEAVLSLRGQACGVCILSSNGTERYDNNIAVQKVGELYYMHRHCTEAKLVHGKKLIWNKPAKMISSAQTLFAAKIVPHANYAPTMLGSFWGVRLLSVPST